jgi:membrane protease YdiL (CAAX protease family)
MTADRRVPLEVAVGIVVGGTVMAVIFGMEWAFGVIQVTQSTSPGELVGRWVVFLAVAAVLEEVLSRSFLLGGLILLLGDSKWIAVLISAAFFGMAHITNPEATVISVAGNTLGGVVYAVAYVGSGRIWLACGLHFAWNFFQGPVLGFPVSGISIPSLVQQGPSGPDWITGGDYGPEGGVIGLSSRLAVIALLFMWFKWRQPERSWWDLLRFG